MSAVDRLVNALVKPPANGGNKKKAGNKGRTNPRGGQRARGAARNPMARRPRDNMLALTRDQFTATSPTNYFTVGPGSTPGGVRVRGRELISNVGVGVTTGVFTLSNQFDGTGLSSYINPIAFPRLQAYNSIYEYFKFHKIDFLFQSNQPTTAGGEIMMCIDYDPTDAAPTSTQAVMRNISSTMANVYSDCSLQGLASLSRLPKYETGIGAGELLQQLQGKLFVATEGVITTGATTVGYIIAQYDVEFFTPQ